MPHRLRPDFPALEKSLKTFESAVLLVDAAVARSAKRVTRTAADHRGVQWLRRKAHGRLIALEVEWKGFEPLVAERPHVVATLWESLSQGTDLGLQKEARMSFGEKSLDSFIASFLGGKK